MHDGILHLFEDPLVGTGVAPFDDQLHVLRARPGKVPHGAREKPKEDGQGQQPQVVDAPHHVAGDHFELRKTAMGRVPQNDNGVEEFLETDLLAGCEILQSIVRR